MLCAGHAPAGPLLFPAAPLELEGVTAEDGGKDMREFHLSAIQKGVATSLALRPNGRWRAFPTGGGFEGEEREFADTGEHLRQLGIGRVKQAP